MSERIKVVIKAQSEATKYIVYFVFNKFHKTFQNIGLFRDISFNIRLFHDIFCLDWKNIPLIQLIYSSLFSNILWSQNVQLLNKNCFVSYLLLVYLLLKKQEEHLLNVLIP